MKEIFFHWVEVLSLVIEGLAVAIIVVNVFNSTLQYFLNRFRNRTQPQKAYRKYRYALAHALMLGLEILVAADVVRTIALEPTLENVAVLGLLVLIRIVLGWSLVVEIEGRWPWQPERIDEEGG